MSQKNKKNIAAVRVSFICGLLIFIFILCEISVRLVYSEYLHSHLKHLKGSLFSSCDKKLGWKGKRVFGDFNSKKYKVFVIGDSFTHGCGVREEALYYNVLARKLNVELFVYGGPGYGTLQEYMVLDSYIDVIKPHLIILQVCSNDFINNMWELESVRFHNNDLMIRPYLREGKVDYLYPKQFGKLKMIIFSQSKFLYLSGYSLEKFIAMAYFKNYIPDYIKTKHREARRKSYVKYFDEATAVTRTLFGKIATRARHVPIIAFQANTREHERFKKIFKELNIQFIEEIPDILQQKENEGISTSFPGQTHWNELGHELAGTILCGTVAELIDNSRN
ncbi:MAG: SGNH/GDSL hydrolase family protein [Candidatus Omnitrophica bacterium]|nr:SGNH/GDSL hydrolase family protein [Candidatus Omnitrophota bacterium]